jgi:protein gp37
MKPETVLKLRDAFIMASDALQEELQSMAPVETIDLNKIAWVNAEGDKGPYQKSEDLNNQEFKRLLKALEEHSGKMQIDQFFLWTFQNGTTIGRKLRKRG